MPKTNKQKARDVNVSLFGSQAEKTLTNGEWAGFNKLPPKAHTDFRKIESYVNKCIEEEYKEKGLEIPKGLSILRAEVFNRLRYYAMREPYEGVDRVKCPACNKNHLIMCPNCKDTHSIKLPSAPFEKTTISALLKYADKFAPNLAAITQDINVNFIMQTFSNFIVKMITRYVPKDKKEEEMMEYRSCLTEIQKNEEA